MTHHVRQDRDYLTRRLNQTAYALAAVFLTTCNALPSALADERLRGIDATVLSAEQREDAREMLRRDFRRRILAANDASRQAWNKIHTLDEWQRFRNPRIEALRRSLGRFPDPANRVDKRVAGTLAGDGFAIENVVFDSWPGLWITANLYKPEPRRESMPGILICHSHHTPKTHGELQDMGMTWARQGCLVLVMDQIGHGERGQHGFNSSDDYPREFRVSRQDYYFRYDVGIQLHLAGRSLIAQIAYDLSRGVDLLLAERGIDPQRIILLGAVAGGGDPAAVAAAVDERIAAAVPFNFGGPQPETRYPLPDDAETSFNYAGGGSWESTRNLRRSAADGFLPWVIVGGIAPRRLIFAHEFNWDRPRDPVWKRLEAIYGLYGQPDHLAFTQGRGELRGRPPESTHCTHIGQFHRRLIHPALDRWFDIPDATQHEYSNRREPRQLRSMTDQLRAELQPLPLHQLLGAGADALVERREDETFSRERLRRLWQPLLDDVAPGEPRVVENRTESLDSAAPVTVSRIVLETEPQILVPLLLLSPAADAGDSVPVVVGVAHAGKQAFLEHRSDLLARLLDGNVAVCLPDLRGTGETRPDDGRTRNSSATSLSSGELMLGGTHVGARLRDLRSLLRYLRTRKDVDAGRLVIWGDSFSDTNSPETRFDVPRGIDGRPQQSEPLGGLLALFAGLFEDQLCAVYVHRGLAGYRSVLDSPFVYLPHDAVIPGALTAGDLCDVAAALAPMPLRLEGLVDGLNREVSPAQVREAYRAAVQSYAAGQPSRLVLDDRETSAADWLVVQAYSAK